MVWEPSKAIVYGGLGFPSDSELGHNLAVFLAFLVSGILHYGGDVAANPSNPSKEYGAMIFFATQGLGVLLEKQIESYRKRRRGHKSVQGRPSVGVRVLGYLYVVAFLSWSVPAWLYPPLTKAPVEGNVLLPFSVVKPLLIRYQKS